jgi:hypothetical protein
MRYVLAALLALAAAPAAAMPLPKKSSSPERAAAAVTPTPRAPRKRIDSRPRVAQTDMSQPRRR